MLFRLNNQMQFFNLEHRNKQVQKHALYTICGYITAFIMILGYIVFMTIDLNINHNIEDFFILITSILFWGFGVWNILSGLNGIVEQKDSDFIFSLPIKQWEAKLIYLLGKYLVYTILTFSILTFGSILVTYFNGISQFFFISFLVIVLSFVIPLISINLTFLISILVRNILEFIKLRHNVLESLITLSIFISPLIYFIITSKSINYKEWFTNASILRYSLNEINTLSFLGNLFLLLAITLITTSLVIYILIAFYDFLKTQINKQGKRRSSNSIVTVKSPMHVLLLKEFKLYFSSFTYVSNTILTPAALIILNISILIGLIPNLVSFSYDLFGITLTGFNIFLFINIILITLTTTTSCSISFEGQKIWMMQVMPIDIKKIALGKIIINVLLFLPGIILSSIVFYAVFNVSIFYGAMMTVLLLSTSFFISIAGFLVDLSFPSYTWNNDMEVVKQSRGTLITAVISMVVIPVMILLNVLGESFLILFIVIEIVTVIIMFKNIARKNLI